MGDAEYMYENDLDPLHRIDRNSGELVEWEGGLNPIYREEKHSRNTRNTFTRKSGQFSTFKEAMEWAKNNPGKTITRSPDGVGFIVKK